MPPQPALPIVDEDDWLGDIGADDEQDEPNSEGVALANDAASLLSRGRFEEATVCYREALELSPSLQQARMGAAVAFLALARPAEAMIVIRPLAERNQPSAVILAGRILATEERFSDAVELLDGALNIHPDSWLLWRARGQHLYSLGRFVDAASSFEKALQRNSAETSAWLGFANSALKLSDDKRSRLALAGYLGVAHPADEATVRFAQRELARLAVK
jgi:Flp pilus assembly protein TadD